MSTQDRTLGFLLASVLSNYPDQGFEEYVQALLADEALDDHCRVGNPEAWTLFKKALIDCVSHSEKMQELSSDYIDIFDRSKQANPLYETEYGRSQVAKGSELADIAGFYKAFGLQLNDQSEAREMLDHVSREFEFYAVLLMKQRKLEEHGDSAGVEVVSAARKNFLKDHLGRFVGTIASRPGVVSHPFYSTLFNWARELVADECKAIEVIPIPIGYSGSAEMAEAMSCGATSGLNLSGRTAQERMKDLDQEVSS